MSLRRLTKMLREAAKNTASWRKDMSDGELKHIPTGIRLYPSGVLKLRVMDAPTRTFLPLYSSLYIRLRVGLALRREIKAQRIEAFDIFFNSACNKLLGIEQRDD